MGQPFSIAAVVRTVPPGVLRAFLDRLGVGPLPVDWDRFTARNPAPVVSALEALPSGQYDEVEAAFHTVAELACDTGLAAVAEAAAALGTTVLPPDLPDDAGVHERAMRAYAAAPEVIERAVPLHQLEHLIWWRRRDDLPRKPADTSDTARKVLSAGLSALFLKAQGRGRRCTVEVVSRRGTDYFFVYPDDYLLSVTAHDDHGRLRPRAVRRTFSVVLAFEPAAGALELCARLGPKLKQTVERVFAQAVLGVDLGPFEPRRQFELNGLKDHRGPLPTDPADGVYAEVKQLRLSTKSGHRQIVLKADPERAADAFAMLHEVLDRENLPLSAVNVTLATFAFFRADGKRAGSATFDVAFPHHIGLRNQRPDRHALVMKYLTRWGIHVGGGPEPGVGRLDSEPPLFFAGDLDPVIQSTLIAWGWLREVAPRGFAACRGCGRGRVEWFEDPAGGPPRGLIPCPECGPSEVDPETLRR